MSAVKGMDSPANNGGLLECANLAVPKQAVVNEQAWIDVIQKMDLVYAELIHHQVELEKKNAELEQAQQFISGVLSAMTDVLIVCDARSVILEANAALEKLTGFPLASVIGKPLDELFDTDLEFFPEAFSRRFGNDSLNDCEVRVRCSDGGNTPLAMNCSPRYDSRGRFAGAVIIGRPMGELRRAYEELNQAHFQLQQTQQQLVQTEKMASLGRLVAGVAHELNNPISFVFGNMHALKHYGANLTVYLDELGEQVEQPRLRQLRKELRIDHILEDMGSLIDGTLEGAERVSDIVQDLRRYSGGKKEQITEFDLVLVVKKAVEWVAKASRIKPAIEYRLPDCLRYRARKGQIHQVLVNLIQNSLDAMSGVDKPVLELCLEITETWLLIHVADRGPGISSDDMAKIFDPFFTSKPVGQGTGLGLYISYGLAQDLGGELKVENRLEGGAVFTLSLPLEHVPNNGQ
ncbi:PAS domain-containing sensor histidine kinase [Thiolapillus sp.]